MLVRPPRGDARGELLAPADRLGFRPRRLTRLRCPLCEGEQVRNVAASRRRRWLECPCCRLTFVDPRQRPTPLTETLRYLHHSADPHDRGHRAFLSQRLAPLLRRLQPGAHGLDYGSGAAGTLAALMAEHGYVVDEFDPCFAHNEELLAKTYDFVTCTEVIEHFHEPRRELATIARLLGPASWLAVSTLLVDDQTELTTWWYARDETHVSFYRRETLAWIAGSFGWELVDVSAGSALFLSRQAAPSMGTAWPPR